MKLLFAYFISAISFFIMPQEIKREVPPANQEQTPLFLFGVIADVQYSDYDPAGSKSNPCFLS